MTKGRKLLLVAALAAMASFVVIGGAPSIATGDDLHPTIPCTWTIDKSASLDSHFSSSITSLTLAFGESITVYYKLDVTRTCPEGANAELTAGVTDSYYQPLPDGNIVDHLDHSASFTYTRVITADSTALHGDHCGTFDVDNTANVIDGGVLATDSVTIHVTVPCVTGCTLTQGYWKTHSILGPAAKPDPTWNLVGGPNTPFFLSGQSWFQVFWTAPGGNAYYILADQYMAARLNILNGASAPASVTSAITTATGLFNTYTPAQIGALSGSDALRKQFIALAGTLDSYNQGTLSGGPPHCDEDH